MELGLILFRTIFQIIAIVVAGFSYIYATKILNSDIFIGIVFFTVVLLLFKMLFLSVKCLLLQWNEVEASNCKKHIVNSLDSILTNEQDEHQYDMMPEYFHSQITSERTTETISDISDDDNTPLKDDKEIKDEISSASNNKIVMQQLREYTSSILVPYFGQKYESILLQILEDYANGNMVGTACEVRLRDLKGLTINDLYHYIWNVWVRLKPMNRRTTSRFLKKAFPLIFEKTQESTIYAKMCSDEGAYTLKLRRKEEALY